MQEEILLRKILQKYDIEYCVQPYGNGHINDTYRAEGPHYILQRINTDIFKDSDALMENIENVTSYLREQIILAGGDPDRETLNVVKTTEGKNCYKAENGDVYRVYKFIENTRTIEESPTADILYHAGIGFGRFQKMLDGFPAEKLHETIKDFHHTPKRVEALKAAIERNAAGRADSVSEEISFALKYAEGTDAVVRGMEEGKIPLRVTHNDTKINNILFDVDSPKAVAVIDLDTVMPGSMLYDFGDALRIGGSTGAEDETDLSKVHFSRAAFEAFAGGYLSEMGGKLTPTEIELLPYSVRLLTYECGIRFLTDYLNGDTYFKIHREHHNLDRARNQFKLVAELASMEDELKEVVRNILANKG